MRIPMIFQKIVYNIGFQSIVFVIYCTKNQRSHQFKLFMPSPLFVSVSLDKIYSCNGLYLLE